VNVKSEQHNVKRFGVYTLAVNKSVERSRERPETETVTNYVM